MSSTFYTEVRVNAGQQFLLASSTKMKGKKKKEIKYIQKVM
jgi:hypothetical protein